MFAPGTRVKRVKSGASLMMSMVPLGSTGTVLGPHQDPEACCVQWDHIADPDARAAGWMNWSLAPLTDPRCSEFISDMNRFSVAAKKQVKELSPEQLERVQGGSCMYLTRPDGFYLVTSSGARRISK